MRFFESLSVASVSSFGWSDYRRLADAALVSQGTLSFWISRVNQDHLDGFNCTWNELVLQVDDVANSAAVQRKRRVAAKRDDQIVRELVANDPMPTTAYF